MRTFLMALACAAIVACAATVHTMTVEPPAVEDMGQERTGGPPPIPPKRPVLDI